MHALLGLCHLLRCWMVSAALRRVTAAVLQPVQVRGGQLDGPLASVVSSSVRGSRVCFTPNILGEACGHVIIRSRTAASHLPFAAWSSLHAVIWSCGSLTQGLVGESVPPHTTIVLRCINSAHMCALLIR